MLYGKIRRDGMSRLQKPLKKESEKQRRAHIHKGRQTRIPRTVKQLVEYANREPLEVSMVEKKFREMYLDARVATGLASAGWDRLNPMIEVHRILGLPVSNAQKINYLAGLLYSIETYTGEKGKAFYQAYQRVILRTIDHLHTLTLKGFEDDHPRIVWVGKVEDLIAQLYNWIGEGYFLPLTASEIAYLFAYTHDPKDLPRPVKESVVKKSRNLRNIKVKDITNKLS